MNPQFWHEKTTYQVISRFPCPMVNRYGKPTSIDRSCKDLFEHPPGIEIIPASGIINRCIIGGQFYHWDSYPAELSGNYFFADCQWNSIFAARFDANNQIESLRRIGLTVVPFNTGHTITTLKSDPISGDFFITTLRAVYRLEWRGESGMTSIGASEWLLYR